MTYSWKEGNNTLSNSKSFSQSYSVGIHTITLYVKDNDGNERSDSVVITVLKITTINSVSFSPSSFEKTNSINVTVNVGLDVGLGGYLQVQLGSVQSGMYVSGSQCTIKTLVLNNVDVSAYDLGSRSMTSYVQFRPGATSGPLTNSLAGDIVASPAYMFQVVPKYSKVTDPHPTNNQQDISLSPTLSWLPNGNPAGTKYRIYFGLSTTNLDLKREDTNTVYGITNLNYDTQYFWRIDTVQSDGYTAITGDSWNFKTVKNQDPIAVAGPDQTVEVGATVTLDASASHDPEGSPLTYRWYEHGDVFSNDKVAHTIFSEPGDHIITLDVLDPEGNEGMDVLTISVIKYSLEVTKYEDDFHNDIYGAFAKTAPYNDYEYDITTMVKIGLKNTGSVKDSYTASSNTNQNIRLDIFDPIWGLGAAEHTSTPQNSVTFSLNPGEEKELAIRIMTPPGTAVGSIINIPITISSATKPNLKIETNVAYEVLDTLDMDMYTINTLFKKLVFNYDVAFDNNAPIGSRAFEFAMAGITIIPIAGEGKLLFKAATVTGEEAVARELTVDELRSMAAETGVKGALGRVALTEAERALVKEIIVREMGEDSAKVFLEKLAGKGFEEEYLRALYELKDVEGFDNFLREAVSNGIGQETALSNFYHVARSARGWMVSSEVEKIALEKEFRVVINGAEVVSKPDIFVTFKNGKSAFVECKDIEIVSSDLGTVEKFKPAQYSRYNQVINSGQIAGVNSENTEIVYQIRGFAEGVTEQQQQQIISEIAAKLQGQYVDKRIIGTGLIIPAYISYKAVNDNNQQLQVSPNHAPGTYHSSVNMTFVEKNNRSVDVYYTLDGTDPGFFSAKYDSAWPVIINKSINVKYFAVDKETNAKTPIQTATYTIDNSQSKKIKVYDGTKLLDGLMVLLEKNGVNYFMNSSEAGVWSIPDVTPGQYNLTIKKIGYQDFTTTINPADSQNFTFTLQKEVTATPKFKWRLKI